MYPTTPTTIRGGVSMIVTASTTSCLWDSEQNNKTISIH